MNRDRVYGLASEALAVRATTMPAQDEVAPPDFVRRGARPVTPYDRATFLFDLSCQLAAVGSGSKPKPGSDEGWAEAVVQSYLARTAATGATPGSTRAGTATLRR